MAHVRLLLMASAMLVGVWASAIAYQRARTYAYRFLRPIADYTIIFNLGIVSLFFARYLSVNLPGQFFREHGATVRDLADLVISVLVVGLLASMLRIVLGFRDKELPLLVRRCILVALAVIVIAYAGRMAVPDASRFLNWIDPLRKYVLEQAIILEIPLLVVLLVQAAKGKDRAEMMRTFAYLYLSRYLVTGVIVAVILTVGMREPLRLTASLCALAYFSVIPLIWYRLSFWQFARHSASAFGGERALADLSTRHGLSQREGEVVKLILDGRSNKEIENALCISIHTVKNHIYNIYQKLGVKSRYELVHLVLNAAAPEPRGPASQAPGRRRPAR